MRAKLVKENINDMFKPKQSDEILDGLKSKYNIENINDLYFSKTDEEIAVGSHFLGYIETSYDKLVKLFGEPYIIPDPDKQLLDWNIKDNKHNILEIYDYKSGLNLDVLKRLKSYKWHIGGLSHEAADKLKAYIMIN